MGRRETIEYNGKRYHRYPDAKQRNHRVYYTYHGKWKQPPVALHRQIWMDNFGEIPKGCHIHHKDGNPDNNSIDNLECITAKEHIHKHPMSEEERERRRKQGKIKNNLVEWQKKNKEKHIEICRQNAKKGEYLQKWREDNPELASKTYKEAGAKGGKIAGPNNWKHLIKWAEDNPELVKANRERARDKLKTIPRKDNSEYLRKWKKDNPELAKKVYSEAAKKGGNSKKKKDSV